jgi:two-component sensor histidine kinase
VALPIGDAIPYGSIINELVSNVLKQGFPGDKDGKIIARDDPYGARRAHDIGTTRHNETPAVA